MDMDFSTLITTNETKDLIGEYNSNILEKFHSKMTDIFYNKINEMTISIIEIRDYYKGNNNINYISQVMQDSISLSKKNPKNNHFLNLFMNDINFSKDSAYNIVNNNFEHIDIISNHLIDLNNIEEMNYYILDYINNNTNNISIYSTLLLEELTVSLMELKAVLKKHLYQINNMQVHALNIINTVVIIKKSLLNAPNDLEDDETE